MDPENKAFSFPTLAGGGQGTRSGGPSEPNSTRKYAEAWIGKLLLTLSVLGGSSLGIVANSLPAEGPLLLNAWRFQALLFASIFLIPFYYLYDRYYLKY